MPEIVARLCANLTCDDEDLLDVSRKRDCEYGILECETSGGSADLLADSSRRTVKACRCRPVSLPRSALSVHRQDSHVRFSLRSLTISCVAGPNFVCQKRICRTTAPRCTRQRQDYERL
ncbi:hypothetical protein DOTSEDRAFT_44792 [Dothistroma septosporum NZE10]|uniref:Uncharacterized protein n=1 Tax=Dothistroma septosporum (strain NZE10 / CBS 128990) TaxID=675120 RepID=N1PMJ0_DOTSN|nr:hypothetical protein DOTSEDRAFT_44792 [Dothistroma septosporum NZE10]